MASGLRDLKPGTEIDGFTLGARVHTGSMSAIYRVTKPGIELPLAMKLPLVGPDESRESIVAFETEAAIMPALKGPHVSAFVAAGDIGSTPYLVVEWIEGRSVEDVVGGAPVGPTELAAVGAALADALHSLHQQGVVHLDVKPGNAVLRTDGTIVLIDFGLAHRMGQPDLLAEEMRFGVGSAPYVSPEQLLGSREDPRSDLFGLGAVLYELSTARLPFGDPDTDVRNRFWLEPVPPRALVPDMPLWLQEIILRSLEPRAERRYQSAAHVAFDLRHPEQVALTARATKVRRPGALTHLRRFVRVHAELRPRLRSPPSLPSPTPIVLAAIDTSCIDDERHAAIRRAVSQVLAHGAECRLICLTVIPRSQPSLAHLVRLRQWAAPLGLSSQRLTLHAIESAVPADAIVELARHNNVDLVVLGAPAEGGRAWAQSVASEITGRVRCSVHVVRVPQR